MDKQIISTPAAPAAIGPYSQAVRANGFIFVSGALPIDAESGGFAPGGIGEMTRACIRNIAAILEAAGSGLEKVVKTTVYLVDLGDFAEMNAAYAEFFAEAAPARACVQVAKLPKGAPVEIEAIALG